MLKLTTLALVAGLATMSTVLPSHAQFAVPGGPNNPVVEATDTCTGPNGFVRRVSVAEINAIHDQKVWLDPVCEDTSLVSQYDIGSLFLDGNANTLRQPIARNATLMNALHAKGYDENDVVSVVFGARNSVLLYVHQRDVR